MRIKRKGRGPRKRTGIWIPAIERSVEITAEPKAITGNNLDRKCIHITNEGPHDIVISQVMNDQHMDFYVIPGNNIPKVFLNECAIQQYWCRTLEGGVTIVVREEV